LCHGTSTAKATATATATAREPTCEGDTWGTHFASLSEAIVAVVAFDTGGKQFWKITK
jgi:hypothetical protein